MYLYPSFCVLRPNIERANGEVDYHKCGLSHTFRLQPEDVSIV